MALNVTLTISGTPYDVTQWVIKDSIEIIEELFNDDLAPNTNRATLTLSRTCPYIDEILTATSDIAISISDGSPLFAGYLTNDHSFSVTLWGASDLELKCEDPGIVKLKRAWISADGIGTTMVGYKVCDPADTAHSVIHTIATLSGTTLAASLPSITSTVYLTVLDKDGKTYWDILAEILTEFKRVFYFTRDGKLALYDLTQMSGTTGTLVSTQEGILSREGNQGISYKKRLWRYDEIDVSFAEVETLASAVVFKDTTGQVGTYECNIAIAAGAYYPTNANADTYAFIDYFSEDGREIIAVGSGAIDFQSDNNSAFTVEFTHVGKSGKIRIKNNDTIPHTISRLRVNGTTVVVKRADSKVIAGNGGKLKNEIETKHITTKAQAQELANLIWYFYKNSHATYSFRAFMGFLYPSDSLVPSDTLYPAGDELVCGEIVHLVDPVFTGLDTYVCVTRKKWTVGKNGADYEAVGIGAISLNDSVAHWTTSTPAKQVPQNIALNPKQLSSLTDPVDFDGQYGIYNGVRYRGTMPNTWTRDDAGQTQNEVITLVQTNTPKYLGRYNAANPTNYLNGDWWLVYDTDDSPIQRGVWYSNAGTPARITTSSSADLQGKMVQALADIAWAEANGYGEAADYGGFDAFFSALGAVSAYIQKIFTSSINIIISAGDNPIKQLFNPYNLGQWAYFYCNNNTSYKTAIISSIKSGSDGEKCQLQIGASGTVRLSYTIGTANGTAEAQILRIYNGGMSSVVVSNSYYSTTSSGSLSVDAICTAGDVFVLQVKYTGSGYGVYVKQYKMSVAETGGVINTLGITGS